MTSEELQAIIEEEIPWSEQRAYADEHPECSILAGLMLMGKYIKKGCLIEGADHDIIYGPNYSDLAPAGITEEDAKTLRLMGWHSDMDGVAHYV